MKKSLILIAFFISIAPTFGQYAKKYAVLFGERSEFLPESEDDVIRIFLDQDGFIYPDLMIPDRKLKRNKNSIAYFLKKHTPILNKLCKLNDISIDQSTYDKTTALNSALVDHYVRLINEQLIAYESVYFLIHGFRKRAYGNAQNLSTMDNASLIKDIKKNGKKSLFIEIYWDSKYISTLRSYKYRGFKLMEKGAIPNAKNAGFALRQIVSSIDIDTLNVVAHSLGAVVATELLFSSFNNKRPTPSQNTVNLCLIAPAIGSEHFENYYQRNSTLDYKKNDNYRLYIIYNPYDFVLNKTFHWGPIYINVEPPQYGSTSLGCNYQNDIAKLKTLFDRSFTFSTPPTFIEISQYNNGASMGCHLIRCYTHSHKFAEIPMFR